MIKLSKKARLNKLSKEDKELLRNVSNLLSTLELNEPMVSVNVPNVSHDMADGSALCMLLLKKHYDIEEEHMDLIYKSMAIIFTRGCILQNPCEYDVCGQGKN
jgi:hypothetical protein